MIDRANKKLWAGRSDLNGAGGGVWGPGRDETNPERGRSGMSVPRQHKFDGERPRTSFARSSCCSWS